MKTRIKTLITLEATIFASFSLLLPASATTKHLAKVADLRCEYLTDPLGIDVEKPRLSWKIETQNPRIVRGINQSAYHVLVASTRELLMKGLGDWATPHGSEYADTLGLEVTIPANTTAAVYAVGSGTYRFNSELTEAVK